MAAQRLGPVHTHRNAHRKHTPSLFVCSIPVLKASEHRCSWLETHVQSKQRSSIYQRLLEVVLNDAVNPPGARTAATRGGTLRAGWPQKVDCATAAAGPPGTKGDPQGPLLASSAVAGGSDSIRRSGEKGAGSLRTGGVPGENVTVLLSTSNVSCVHLVHAKTKLAPCRCWTNLHVGLHADSKER